MSADIATLITDCLNSTNIAPTNTLYRERALAFANYVYLRLLQGKHWSFTNREQTFELTQPYATGTVKLTQDSSIVEEDVDTVNGAVPVLSWNSKILGQLFTSGSHTYRILKTETVKKMVLAADYTGETASYQPYKILFDRYKATAHVQDIKSLTLHMFGEIALVNLQRFREKKESNPTLTGIPRWATVTHIEADSGQIQIEVYPAPDKRYTVTLEYSERPLRLADDGKCYPLIPPEHMPALYYGVLEQIYILQNNGAMAQAAGKHAFQAALKMAADHEVTDPVARIQHGRRYFNRERNWRGYYGLRWFGKVED
jgi:hypothetical protein